VYSCFVNTQNAYIDLPLIREGITRISLSDLPRVVGKKLCRTGGYVSVELDGHKHYLHRYLKNFPFRLSVDHRNRKKWDNRQKNLRVCSHAANLANSKLSARNTSGYRGVTRSLKKWLVTVWKNRKCLYFGVYADKEVAARVRDREALRLHGEFAYLNFPSEDNRNYKVP